MLKEITPVPGYLEKIKAFYGERRGDIEARLEEFRNVWRRGDDRDIHVELSFCVLTPQSKARSAWAAISTIRDNGLLWSGSAVEIAPYLRSVRFFNNKARFLVELREKMTRDGRIVTKEHFASLGSPAAMRDWIVGNVKGMSFKEAGHFIRNVGFGDDIAILDRHILKNLARLGAIDSVPESLTPRLYLEIEEKMRRFCSDSGIPMASMDLLLWCLEAGEIFK